MQGKIILISDDSNFFEYIIPKLSLRNSDEVFRFSFNELADKFHLIEPSLLIVNCEGAKQKTLELFDVVNNLPVIVFGYNDDEEFKIKAYKKGMFSYFALSVSDKLIEAGLISAFNYLNCIEQNAMYRDMLVKSNQLTKHNEVYLDFNEVLDREIDNIQKTVSSAVLIAISPNDKAKFLIPPNKIETIILNNVRKNDILMNYASNKYFLLLHNADLTKAEKIWQKLQKKLPEGVHAGIAYIGKKSRQLVVNEALNNLHTAMSSGITAQESNNLYSNNSFKFFRQEFNKKIEQIITPVFYQIQQTYNDKLFGMNIEQGQGDGYGVLYIKSCNSTGTFRITSPGFSTINIDISYEANNKQKDDKLQNESKRIKLEPEELEAGLLQDLLEQFILEFKQETNPEV